MSSAQRLRARIARDDLDGSEVAKANESFVLIGTPLPPLFDKKNDPNEVIPSWTQTAEEDPGRRRFHGAFTAGYHNTVGSKEGWTPSTFVSSRRTKKDGDDKPAPTRQRVEDFMDEEDLAELEQSRRLSQRAGYSATEKTRHDNGDVLNDLLGLGSTAAEHSSGPMSAATSGLVAPQSSLGHRILSKMGWKAGWGLGPLMTRTRRRALEMLYTGAVSAVAQKTADDEVLVPPPDTPMPGIVGDGIHRNTYGLGWRADQQQPLAAKESLDRASSGHRLERSSLTALDDEDQADIYGSSETLREAMERRKRDAMGIRTPVASRRDDIPSERLAIGEHKAEDDRRRWKDGKKVPPGFMTSEKDSLASSAQSGQEWYAPPEVPKHWKPDPARVWSLAKNAQVSAPTSRQMNAADRAVLLGEARNPGPPPSLSSYLSNMSAAGPPGPPPTPPPSATPVRPASTTVDAPRIDVATAKAALTGFVPFGNDEAKQERYKAYLRLQSDPEKAARPYDIIPGKTFQQTLQELQEFARSASIFKPMSSVMASRFASAATVEGSGDANAPTPGLYQPTAKSKEEKETETKRQEEEEAERIRREKEENMTDRQKAAKANMFGHLTREVSEWCPPRLLCKRFGVSDPHPDRSAPSNLESNRDVAPGIDAFQGGGQQDRFERSHARREIMRGEARWEQSRRELMGMVGERKWEDRGGQPIAIGVNEVKTEAESTSARAAAMHALDLEQVGLGEDERQLREIDNFVKPSRKVLRSVFASDEEDDQPHAEDSNEAQMAERRDTAAVPDSSATPGGGPMFVPRSKRIAGSTNEASAESKRRKKEKKRAKQGALTFDMDDGEGDADDLKPLKKSKSSASAAASPAVVSAADAREREMSPSSQKAAPVPTAKPGRMKASDLF